MIDQVLFRWFRALAMVAVAVPLALACGDDGAGSGDDDDDMMMGDDDDDDAVPGCADENANNFDPDATVDDGTCLYSLTLSVDTTGIEGFLPDDGVCIQGSLTTEDCLAMTQVDDSAVWTVTVELLASTYTYNFAVGDPPSPESVPEVCSGDGTSVRSVQVPDIGDEVDPVGFGACTVLPFAVDDQYSASGFFEDGETPGRITVEEECPERGGEGRGACRTWSYTSTVGVGGVIWQFPEDNFGEEPGYPMPQGATRVSFAAWGAEGGEQVDFFVGAGGDDVDGFERRTSLTLTDEPTVYTVDVVGTDYDRVVGGFAWVATLGAGNSITFYTDDVVWERNEDDFTDRRGCTDENATNFDPTATVDDGSCRYSVTFNVDMSCSELESFETVHLTGPFCGFCGSGFDLFDPDDDDVYTGTFDFGEDVLDEMGRLEHLYIVDTFRVKEDLYDDVLAGATCAPINGPDDGTGSPFANRLIPITSGDVETNDTFGSCSDCP